MCDDTHWQKRSHCDLGCMTAVAAGRTEHPRPDTIRSCTRQILDESGIVLVPGSGFGQEEGTLHFRTTFLPAEETMHETLKMMAKAHEKFMDEHRD